MKITVVGAGAVGASCAEYIAMKNFASEVVLVDVKEGLAEGKAMDLMQTASFKDFNTRIIGTTGDYGKTANSEVIVVTSGVPRKPGMTREELVNINAEIVLNVTRNALKYSPDAILIMVTNPMDTMTYLAHKSFNLPKNRIIGMGGALDTARFRYRLAEILECPISDVEGMVIAAHSDTGMLPLISKATRNGVPVEELIDKEKQNYIVEETKIGGATLVKLLGTSAWYAPGAAVAGMVHSILGDHKKMIPCSAWLDGEYGEKDICLGVPCIVGRNGIEEIIELSLNDEEREKFRMSAEAVRKVNQDLKI